MNLTLDLSGEKVHAAEITHRDTVVLRIGDTDIVLDTDQMTDLMEMYVDARLLRARRDRNMAAVRALPVALGFLEKDCAP